MGHALCAALREPAVRLHLLGLLATTAVVVALVFSQAHSRAGHEAELAARQQVRATAMTLALPLSTADLGTTTRWRTQLAGATQPLLDAGQIVALHIWRRVDQNRGEILWSTDPAKQDRIVPLGGAGEALDTGGEVIERLGDGLESEGPPLPNLYEIYLPFTDRAGTRYVLEIYQPVHNYDAIRDQLLRDWLPLAVAGVLLLGLATLPLSIRLALGVKAAERDRARYAERALTARAEEHQRISEVLHERTVQDLAAVRMILEAIRDTPAPAEVGSALDRATGLLDAEVRNLRALLTAGDGPEWQGGDLTGALDSFLAALPQPPRITLHTPTEPLALSDPAILAVVRIAKEAVRNATKHAAASEIRVRVSADAHQVSLEVADDGCGFDPEADATGVGLRLIRHIAATTGGEAQVDSEPGRGTSIRVQLPR